MKKYNLRGKRVLITGASMGIGKELARHFAAYGADCILASLPSEKDLLTNGAEELQRQFDIKTWTFFIDLSEEDGPEKLYEKVEDEVGFIDVLVNNAGIISYGNFHETPVETHERIITVNVHAYMKLMRLCIPQMMKRGGGIIYNVSSVSAFIPTPHHAVYGGTKAFIQSLSESVAQELKGTGIKVMTLNPGYTKTAILSGNNFPEMLRFYRIAGLKSPSTIARKAVKTFRKSREVFIPGFRNRLIFSLLIRFAPRKMVNYIALLMIK